MTQLTIFSKPGCHLCDVTARMIIRIRIDIPVSCHYVDIAADPQLLRTYGTRIPVIFIDGLECFSGKVTERELRAAIKKARWRGPLSRILSRLRALKQG
jgi:glutaredoxin